MLHNAQNSYYHYVTA